MRRRSWLIIAVFSMMAVAGSKAAASVSSNMSVSTLVSTIAVTPRESEDPTGASLNPPEAQAFTEALLGNDREASGIPDGDAFLEAAMRPPATQSETRVPEPATLVLVGTGLMGLAKVSRSKWRRRSGVGNLISVYAA